MKAKGYTLIEMVIAIVLLGIVFATAGLFLTEAFRSYFAAKPILKVAGKANIAADNLMREIKSAERISAIASNSISFVNQQGQSIFITLSGSNLTRSVNGGNAYTLCSGITGLTFSYFDASLGSTASAANVRYVTLAMTIAEETIPFALIAGTLMRKKL
ncbi:type II secretion system protein [Legionella yabuuchiae]|uniref:type II secretion system protein n=1 Tax=Legionella yabuuchiae TaxID=376727 RepID=UPI0010551BA2|nr:type II secretion system protein [Legionella yabuuchiae]